MVRPYFHAGLLSLTVQASHMGLRVKIGAGHVRLVPSCHISALLKALHLFSDTSHFYKNLLSQ